jgi:TIR domain
MSGSVYISYRRADSAAYAGRLYDYLSRALGKRKIFLDLDIPLGADFRAVIHDAIWTATSVNSKWVKAEATMADFDDKLVPVRPRDLDPRNIPLPFNVQHCEFSDDHKALVKAIQRKGAYPNSRMAIRGNRSIATHKQTGRPWWKKMFGTVQ